jgi:hypothetical protein
MRLCSPSSALFGLTALLAAAKDADFTLDAATSVRNSSVLEPTRLNSRRGCCSVVAGRVGGTTADN